MCIRDRSHTCREHGLYLFLDGARLGYGLTARGSDVSMADLARLCDVFYIGGTKCGALFGEAVVIANPQLKPDFRYSIKQNGGMLAKGRLLGIQFLTLFEDDLYYDICRSANEQAYRIAEACREAGFPFFAESPTNQPVSYTHLAYFLPPSTWIPDFWIPEQLPAAFSASHLCTLQRMWKTFCPLCRRKNHAATRWCIGRMPSS